MKLAAIIYALTGLSVLVFLGVVLFPVAGILGETIAVHLLVLGVVTCAFLVLARTLYLSLPRARTCGMAVSLFLVGAASYVFVYYTGVNESARKFVHEPGIGFWLVRIAAAVGLAHAVALVALLRARRTSTARPA